jgi:hypothetical protein
MPEKMAQLCTCFAAGGTAHSASMPTYHWRRPIRPTHDTHDFILERLD